MKRLSFLIFSSFLLATGCDDDPTPAGIADSSVEDDSSVGGGDSSIANGDGSVVEDDGSIGNPDSSVGDGSTIVGLVHRNLPTLGNGFHYEGWAIVDGAPVSTGKFNVDASGAIVDLQGIAIANAAFPVGRDLSVASEFVLTIESAGDVDIMPSETHLLAGAAAGTNTTLTLTDGTESLGLDFSDAAGTYGLATPTDDDDSNELSGVWFLKFDDRVQKALVPIVPSLTLPTLPAGWVYEGWAVVGDVPISTGRFTDPTMADDAAPHSGTDNPGPPVPGEDLLNNPPADVNFPVNLSGHTIVVSIEPNPDDSPAPFAIKPLSADVPANVMDHKNQELGNNGIPVIELDVELR